VWHVGAMCFESVVVGSATLRRGLGAAFVSSDRHQRMEIAPTMNREVASMIQDRQVPGTGNRY